MIVDKATFETPPEDDENKHGRGSERRRGIDDSSTEVERRVLNWEVLVVREMVRPR
jgi:hypothetical protein